jgi:hypothetical protein
VSIDLYVVLWELCFIAILLVNWSTSEDERTFDTNSHNGEWKWVHSSRRPLNGLLYLPWVIVMMENLVEWRLAGETEVLGENLPQRHFVRHKFHLPDAGWNPGRRGKKPGTNCLSYGAALTFDTKVNFTLMEGKVKRLW